MRKGNTLNASIPTLEELHADMLTAILEGDLVSLVAAQTTIQALPLIRLGAKYHNAVAVIPLWEARVAWCVEAHAQAKAAYDRVKPRQEDMDRERSTAELERIKKLSHEWQTAKRRIETAEDFRDKVRMIPAMYQNGLSQSVQGRTVSASEIFKECEAIEAAANGFWSSVEQEEGRAGREIRIEGLKARAA